MNINDIKNDKELVRKLTSIHKVITKVIDDDYDVDKFAYTENEVGIMYDHKAINQRIAFNRVKKIKALIDLSDNWDNFHTLYKDDVVIKKIGAEFLTGKFEFNQEILKAITEIPHKNEPQFYFKKGEKVNFDNIMPEDYVRIKEQILPSIENASKAYLEQKKIILKLVKSIDDDKTLLYSEKLNSHHPIKLEENSRLNVEYGQEIKKMVEQIRKGNFVAQQHTNSIVAELPIAAIKMEGSNTISSPTILLKLNMDNYKDYDVEVGNLEEMSNSIQSRVDAIRKKAYLTNSPPGTSIQPR